MASRTCLLFAALGLGLALAGPTWAQEAEAADPAAEAAEPAAEPDADAAPDAEAEAEAAPAPEAEAEVPEADAPTIAPPPEPEVVEIIRDQFGDWEVRCAPDGDDCFMYQLALDADENPVAEVSVVRLPAGGDAVGGVTVVTPLGTYLVAGLALQVDGGQGRQYEFLFCSQVGCFARFGIEQTMVDSMKRGRVARMQVASVAAPDQPVTLEVSLAGFTAAYDSLAVPQ